MQGRFGLLPRALSGEGFHLEHSNQEESVNCPVCHSRLVGRLGNSQYYCWDCCVQFSRTGRGLQTYHIDEDGSLVANTGAEGGAHDVVQPTEQPAVHHTTNQGGDW